MLDPGEYHVLVKVTASAKADKGAGVLSTEDAVKVLARMRPRKLEQVARNYDAAYDKLLETADDDDDEEDEEGERGKVVIVARTAPRRVALSRVQLPQLQRQPGLSSTLILPEWCGMLYVELACECSVRILMLS